MKKKIVDITYALLLFDLRVRITFNVGKCWWILEDRFAFQQNRFKRRRKIWRCNPIGEIGRNRSRIVIDGCRFSWGFLNKIKINSNAFSSEVKFKQKYHGNDFFNARWEIGGRSLTVVWIRTAGIIRMVGRLYTTSNPKSFSGCRFHTIVLRLLKLWRKIGRWWRHFTHRCCCIAVGWSMFLGRLC